MSAEQLTLADVIVAAHHGDAESLDAALDATDPHVRSIALSGLHKCAALTPRHIALAITDPERIVRHRLAQLAAHDERIDPLLLLSDADFAIAETAAWALGERDTVDESAMQALIVSATSHPHPLVRESCIAALGSLGDVRGLPAILHACSDKPAVRRRAIVSLAPFDGPDVAAALTNALADRDWQVRQAAEDLLAVGESSDSRDSTDAS